MLSAKSEAERARHQGAREALRRGVLPAATLAAPAAPPRRTVPALATAQARHGHATPARLSATSSASQNV
jgi:hypothetical protein